MSDRPTNYNPKGGLPAVVPGARVRDLGREVANRVAGLLPFRGNQSPTQAMPRREPWFGPGQPQAPMAPAQDVAGRALDYPVGYNTNTRPRQYEGVSFEQLRGLVESCDMVKLAVETCKDQMAALTWGVKPRMIPGEDVRPQQDERCAIIEAFFRNPDRKTSWDAWNRKLDDEQLVIDAATVYIRRDMAGRPYSFEILDGATIVPKLDIYGTEPDPPGVAYQQVLKGMPAMNYSSQDLIYGKRNPRSHKVYGFSAVEQLIMTINVAVRRAIAQLGYFTDGNIPDGVMAVPVTWTTTQIAEWQILWDTVLAGPTSKMGKVKFVPSGSTYQPMRSDAALFGQFDEWLARMICYAFSLPALPFVQQQNRATADSANDAALSQGLAPRMAWRKSVYDRMILRGWGWDDIEFVWDDVEQVDPQEEVTRNLELVRSGIKSIDEMRAEMGLTKIGMDHAIFGIGPMGLTFVSDLLKAQAQGLTAIQPPPQPGVMPGAPGAPPMIGGPAPQGTPPGMDPGASEDGSQGGPVGDQVPVIAPDASFEGIPPELLAAVGLGPAGVSGRSVDITANEALSSHPAASGAANPQVLRTLLTAEAAQRRRGAPR